MPPRIRNALHFVALFLVAIIWIMIGINVLYIDIWSIYLAYTTSGILLASLMLILPGFAQGYLAWAMWPSSYSHAFIIVLIQVVGWRLILWLIELASKLWSWWSRRKTA